MLSGSAHAQMSAPGIDAYRVDWKVWAAWFVGFAVLSAVFPRDAHFDVSHYHLHNGWSLLEGRLLQDMAPAGLHSFLNPVHSAFIWFLVDNLPGPLVVALLSPIHAAILPVTYAFGARALVALNVAAPKPLVGLCAVTGFFALPSVLLVASLGNDPWGSLAFLLALTLLLDPERERPSLKALATGAFLIGAMTGLKLTNAIFIPGFAMFALILVSSWQARFRAAAVCAAAGLAGIILFGGWWALVMWDMFGNPVYPNLNAVFGDSPLGPDAPFRDERYLPNGLWEIPIRPILFSLDGKLIFEYDVVDYRFLVGYLATLGALGFMAWRQMRSRIALPGSRLVLALCGSFLVTFVVWAAMFSILRYAMALWVIVPMMLLILGAWAWPEKLQLAQARYVLLGICGVLLLTLELPEWRRVAWASPMEPYTWAELPESVDVTDGIIVFSAYYPTAFTAPAFEDAAWLTHADTRTWSKPALENYRPLIHQRIAETDNPIFAVLFHGQGSDADDLERMAAEVGATSDYSQCAPLKTGFDNPPTHWFVCPLTRLD